jgi:hypothetical protein
METTQVKVSVDTQIASAFKKACAGANISMAAELSGFMASYASVRMKRKDAPDYSTRRRRRTAIRSIIEQLEQIKACEERVRDNTPENLQGSSVYEAAEEAVSSLEEAIDTLTEFWMAP